MPKIDETIQIDAPPEEVWDLVMDPGRLGEWVTAHRGIKGNPPLPLAEGDEFTQTLCVARKKFDVHWKLCEHEENNVAVWKAKGPRGTNADVRYAVSAADGGSRFDYLNEFELPGGPLKIAANRIAGGPAGRQARQSLANLKKLLES